jgi:hydrogenase maturation protease
MLVIGIGNRLRSDDGLGPVVIERLANLGLSADMLREMNGEGAELMEAWQGTDSVYVVDAVAADAHPGKVTRQDVAHTPLPTGFFHYSSHAFGLAEAVETARALGTLPKHVVVYGIEGECFEIGEGLSPTVAEAAEEVARRIRVELEEWSGA